MIKKIINHTIKKSLSFQVRLEYSSKIMEICHKSIPLLLSSFQTPNMYNRKNARYLILQIGLVNRMPFGGTQVEGQPQATMQKLLGIHGKLLSFPRWVIKLFQKKLRNNWPQSLQVLMKQLSHYQMTAKMTQCKHLYQSMIIFHFKKKIQRLLEWKKKAKRLLKKKK